MTGQGKPDILSLTPAELEVQHMKTEIRTALLELRAPNRNVSGRTAWNRLAALVE